MIAVCPLKSIGHPEMKIPEFCQEVCEAKWDKAVQNDRYSGPFDTYEQGDDCGHKRCGVEYGHDSLKALGKYTREYVIVDVYECGMEIGEQGYIFECPLELET